MTQIKVWKQMPLEIERKFRVSNDFPRSEHPLTIAQGYLCRDPGRTVRVRTDGSQGYLTIKGMGNESGTSRFEWEKAIPLEEALSLLDLCDGLIIKNRHEIPVGQHIFEIDEFLGDNVGLVVAEIELQDEDEEFERPAWLTREVTGDPRYYNSRLLEHPYTKWSADERIGEFFANLAAVQQQLPADMAKILHDNAWDLYET